MNRFLISFGLLVIILFSCEKEENGLSVAEKDCRFEHFYYTDEIIYLDSILQFDYLLIGFDKIYENVDINTFLNNQSVFNNENVVENLDRQDYDYKLIIRKFKSKKSCTEIRDIIENLHDNDTVAFAAYTYVGEACFGWDCTELMSYCNEFYVKVDNPNELDNLYSIVEQTKTWIRKEIGFDGWFVINVDKDSQGNALEMANYFYETGDFLAHPNFFYFNIE